MARDENTVSHQRVEDLCPKCGKPDDWDVCYFGSGRHTFASSFGGACMNPGDDRGHCSCFVNTQSSADAFVFRTEYADMDEGGRSQPLQLSAGWWAKMRAELIAGAHAKEGYTVGYVHAGDRLLLVVYDGNATVFDCTVREQLSHELKGRAPLEPEVRAMRLLEMASEWLGQSCTRPIVEKRNGCDCDVCTMARDVIAQAAALRKKPDGER